MTDETERSPQARLRILAKHIEADRDRVAAPARGKLFDLTGMTFGRLRVVSRAPDHVPPSYYIKAVWNCHCAPDLGGCGGMKPVIGWNLRTGNTQSCGCLQDALRRRPWSRERRKAHEQRRAFPKDRSSDLRAGLE